MVGCRGGVLLNETLWQRSRHLGCGGKAAVARCECGRYEESFVFLLVVKVILVPMVQLLLVVKEIPKVDLVDI